MPVEKSTKTSASVLRTYSSVVPGIMTSWGSPWVTTSSAGRSLTKTWGITAGRCPGTWVFTRVQFPSSGRR